MFTRIYTQYMYSYPHKTAYRAIDRDLVVRHLQMLSADPFGLYLHIPFCTSKCGYCNLFSITNADAEVFRRYQDALQRQLQQYAGMVDLSATHIDSLTLGGGTPILIGPQGLERLLSLIEATFGIHPAQLSSAIELAPQQTEAEIVHYLRACGMQRVSIGVQSFIDSELRTLGRRHRLQEIRAALKLLAEACFPVFNIDLIYGIPGQGETQLLHSLQEALRYQPTELFLYPLYMRPQTGLADQQLDERQCFDLYLVARDFLRASGFRQTSMRRFTRLDESLESDASCGFEQTLALGCGGRSYLQNLHLCEPYAVQPAACRRIVEAFLSKKDFCSGLIGYLLDEDEQRRRYAIKNLLRCRGIDLTEYVQCFGVSLFDSFPFLLELHEHGFLERNEQRLRLSEQGTAYSDAIGPLFTSETVRSLSVPFL